MSLNQDFYSLRADEARQAADEVLFMDGGVIVERGAPADIFTNPREERTRRFLDRILRPLD